MLFFGYVLDTWAPCLRYCSTWIRSDTAFSSYLLGQSCLPWSNPPPGKRESSPRPKWKRESSPRPKGKREKSSTQLLRSSSTRQPGRAYARTNATKRFPGPAPPDVRYNCGGLGSRSAECLCDWRALGHGALNAEQIKCSGVKGHRIFLQLRGPWRDAQRLLEGSSRNPQGFSMDPYGNLQDCSPHAP